ncbi:MAG: cyanophycin synthetase [Bryobacterales bacterium]|nr:cyanophycin synthetase [Bryobacterales bacterium]
MEIRKVLALRGPNIWANFPVIEAWVDLGQWKDSPSDTIPGLNERLMAWLPSMVEHQCSIGKRGGFFQRLREGTYLAHILEHVVLELETLAGVEVSFGRASETNDEGVYKVVFRYYEEKLARECLTAARDLCMAAVLDQPFDVQGAIARLRETAERNMLGPSTNAIVQAAQDRNIPFHRLNRHSLVQLGYGAKQRRIRASETGQTGAIAESIAQDKELTRQLLQAAGVPTAEGYPVDSAEEAWEAALDIGVPVVVKPQDGNQGRGVATNLTTQEQVAAAYQAALQESDSIIVEKFAPGNDYRILVVNGKVVAASRREPAQVMGDGQQTIQELVDRENGDPRRGEHHANVLSKIHIDEVALNVLTDQGYTPASVPPAGQTVLIRRNANLSTGGMAIDVTDIVHPEVAARAIDAARVVGLDVAGIDIIATDISTPLESQGGIVVEVNAAPGLRMHLAPSVGEPQDVGGAIIDMIFPPGENGRIPIAAISGTNGKTTVSRFLAHVLQGTGKVIGMTCTDGIYLNTRRIDSDDCSGPISAGNVLRNPNVEMAVFETARGGILRAGLGFDECDVAIITNIGDGDHLGLSDINTAEDLARVKRCIVDVVRPSGTAVLNAADPLVVAMAPFCPGSVLYFALDPANPVIVAHRAAGGRAVFVRNNTIVLAAGPSEDPLISLDLIPMTFGGRIAFEVENSLAVLGAAWAMGVSRDVMIQQAERFATDMAKVPGRFNILEIHGATVVVDYGHNADALRAIIGALDAFPHTRRTAMYTVAGDRRDSDMIQVGELLGDAFDHVIVYEAGTIRGRALGEIAQLIRKGLASGQRVRVVDEIDDTIEAMEFALDHIQAGELLVLQADAIDETMDFVRDYLDRLHRHIPPPEVTVAHHEPEFVTMPAARTWPPVAPAPRVLLHPAERCAGVRAGAPRGAKSW